MPLDPADPTGTGQPGGDDGAVVALPPTPALVARYSPGDDPPFFILPNLELLSTQERDGPAPMVARYRYRFDATADPAFPRRWDQVFPYAATLQNPFIVGVDDRIVAVLPNPDGSYTFLADGFAQAPQVDTAGDGEQVTIECPDAAVREWDAPLGGQWLRDGDRTTFAPFTGSTSPASLLDVPTDRPARFNPDGRPNATAAGLDSWLDDPWPHPVFFDPLIVRDPDVRRHWTLGMACRYLMARGLERGPGGGGSPGVPVGPGLYVTLPDFGRVDDYLKTYVPRQAGAPVDPDDPGTYNLEEVPVQDVEVTGQAWPDAVARLIDPHGFGVRWELYTDPSTDPPGPVHQFVIYKKDRATDVVPIYQQPPGSATDWSRDNAPSLQLQRDGSDLVNQFYADTQLRRFEVDVVLAPGFTPVKADTDTPEAFALQDDSLGLGANNPRSGPDTVKYRLYHAGEAGDDWYHLGDKSIHNEPLYLEPVLEYFDPQQVDVRKYARVRRPPLRTLFTVNERKEPYHAKLWISTDFAGLSWPGAATPGPPSDPSAPQLWNRTADKAHWREVASSSFRVCDDRLGVLLTMRDIAALELGAPNANLDDTSPLPDGRVDVLTAMADPDAANPRFWLRLTCVIEDDRDLQVVAPARLASPTLFTVSRRDDSRDRFHYHVRDSSSPYSQGVAQEVIEDDTKDAQAHADARRRAHELGKYAGRFTVPWVTLAYRLGQKVQEVTGRDVDLNMSATGAAGEGEVYPTIVAVDRHFGPDSQSTTCMLADRRAEAALAANLNLESLAKRARKSPGLVDQRQSFDEQVKAGFGPTAGGFLGGAAAAAADLLPGLKDLGRSKAPGAPPSSAYEPPPGPPPGTVRW
jgi:hypothetical protein